jgi:hypothetical protein
MKAVHLAPHSAGNLVTSENCRIAATGLLSVTFPNERTYSYAADREGTPRFVAFRLCQDKQGMVKFPAANKY